MGRKYNVAVVGATGAVGKAMIELLEEREFPIEQFYALASEKSAGKTLLFHGEPMLVQDANTFDFSQVDIALFSAGSSISKVLAPKAAAAKCVVIDNTSEFRNEAHIPLVIPEVNPEKIGDFTESYIISNPNCSTIQMLVALKPIYDAVGIERINVATYQAVSGSGKAGVNELAKQVGNLLNARPVETVAYKKQIAFNVIPHIDEFQDNGYTREEMKMVWETRKILDDESIQINPTAARVPVFYGHSEAVHIETKEKITATAVKKLLRKAQGIKLVDDPNKNRYPTAFTEASGNDPVYVGRVREDISHPKGIDLWIVADNVRKGAALNSVQIAELLIKEYPALGKDLT